MALLAACSSARAAATRTSASRPWPRACCTAMAACFSSRASSGASISARTCPFFTRSPMSTFSRFTSGAVKRLNVDIGDRVKKGQVLAEIDAPLLALEEKQAAIAVQQARGQGREAEVRVAAARAELQAAKSAIVQRQAELEGAK